MGFFSIQLEREVLKGTANRVHAMWSAMPFKFEYTVNQRYLAEKQSALGIKVEWTCVNQDL
jgi:hypothetical protein